MDNLTNDNHTRTQDHEFSHEFPDLCRAGSKLEWIRINLSGCIQTEDENLIIGNNDDSYRSWIPCYAENLASKIATMGTKNVAEGTKVYRVRDRIPHLYSNGTQFNIRQWLFSHR